MPVSDSVMLARPLVLLDAVPMMLAAAIVGVFALAMVVVIGLWVVKDRG